MAACLIAGSVVPVSASPPISLSNVAAGSGGFAINGIDFGDRSGGSVSGAGDVNGDGLSDVIVGARRANPGGDSLAGECYVIFGKAGTASVELSDITAGTGGFVINGIDPSDSAGVAVSGAGDVNGDGLADLIVGAHLADPGGDSAAGESYIVFGKTGTAAVELSDVTGGIGGFVINGIDVNDYSGARISRAGDVNGDGLADILVGAAEADPGGDSAAGEGYLIFGKTTTSAIELSDIAAGIGGFVISGIDPLDRSTSGISGAGDLNGDGLGDLIVGAPGGDPGGNSSAGECYVIFGKATTGAVDLSDIAGGTGGYLINGIDTLDFAGASVSGAGDVNGDGAADLIVGAPGAAPNGDSDAGESYVLFGKSDGAPVDLASVASGTGGFIIKGIEAVDTSGCSVSGAGDVNGDGLDDLIVGAYLADTYSGHAYVVFGKTDGAAVELSDVAGGNGGFLMFGIGGTVHTGRSVSDAGDVNGDGLSDVIVGAELVDQSGGFDAGQSYVVFSPEIPPVSPPPGAPASGTYLARAAVGDGAGGAIVPLTNLASARVKIDFSDDDTGSASGSASTETVVLARNDSSIVGLNPATDVANVMWQITTNRTGWTSAEVTLKYTDAEIAGMTEGSIRIFKAPAVTGPWTELTTTLDAARNEAKATVTSFSFFALAEAGTVPVELSAFAVE